METIKPEIGMQVEVTVYTDRYPATVVEISASGKRIKLQRDKATRTDDKGMSESQSYRIERDTEGTFEVASLRKDGRWKIVGVPSDQPGGRVHLGQWGAYHDYSF